MATMLVASRKGLFVWEGEGAAWRIAALHFAGEPVTSVLADPRDGHWYAALRLGHFGVKLHRSADRGRSWAEVAAPAFPPKPAEGPMADDTTPWSVDLVWSMAAGGADEPGVLWAGCLPAGLFRSEDRGASWSLNRPLWEEPGRREWFGGGYDHAGIHSIVVDPRDARHVTLGISCGGVWQTRDAGTSWSLTAQGMKADYLPAESADDGNTQDPHALVQCRAQPDALWVQHHCGIYRSTDGGALWQPITAPAPSSFGFAVACDPGNPQRAWFVPAQADVCRIPVDGRMVVLRTDDGGRSFQAFGDGLPQTHAYHLVYRHALDVDATGRVLAMGSTTGGLWVSADAGEHWQELSRDLPPLSTVRFA
ncbi:WD40/YVTN/BNR-like repeat-containing protein [Hydrogenophaga pseudoflava]|uniref:BNR/Asp-box repeat protein n=1 Tax=Hydrogenophaga pseudoflava TaxID=47421 RepID=A0A4P6WZ80_HYDPS|nr:sialidase family protein [Hydrogenophaga pseudoflava]QBM27685.1 BNR/Asp-box repeat protein [Hydrogenophaga pseudoflava]